MSKPILPVICKTPGGGTISVAAVIDTGSFYSLIRKDCLSARVRIGRLAETPKLRGAVRGSKLRIGGTVDLIVTLGGKNILVSAFVSPNLSAGLIIGAGAMQMWDVSVRNRNGHTKVVVGRDMNDPEITEVD